MLQDLEDLSCGDVKRMHSVVPAAERNRELLELLVRKVLFYAGLRVAECSGSADCMGGIEDIF